MIVPCGEIFFCLLLSKRYRREVEISEYVYNANKQPTVLYSIVTTSGATEIMTSLSWFSSFNSKVRASGMKYYRILVQLKRLVKCIL